MPHTNLSALREEIDQIDEEIIALIARRFRVTDTIGTIKAEIGLNATDPERERMQQQRYENLADEQGIKKTVVMQIFRYLIDEVVSNHIAIAGAQAPKVS